MSSNFETSCWIVSEGVIGMENQCLGLAEALGVKPEVKRIKLRSPWRQLAPFFRFGLSKAFSDAGDPIKPPFPDLMIASGRAGALACLYAHRAQELSQSMRRTFTVYIQNPVIDPSRFDLVALPRHDEVFGPNVITTRGALHRVTPERLAEESKAFQGSFSAMKGPKIAVIIGGSNAVYRLTPDEMLPLAKKLVQAAKDTGGSLLITTSRRTGAENMMILREALVDVPHYLWDGSGPNPYYAMLGLCDVILVTADSVNMCSEACSTGKPVYVIPLAGGSDKFRRFHQTLRDDGLARPFEGKIEEWKPSVLNDVQLVASRVKQMMRL